MDVSARPAPRTGPPPTSPRAPPSNPTKPHSPRPATPPPPPGLPSHALHTTNHPAYPSNFNHNQSIYHSMDVPSPPLSPSSSVVSSKAHQSFRTYNINDESTLGVSAMGSAMGSQAHQSRHNYLPSGMDSSDVARYQSIIAASRPPPQAPMTPPPPSASGLYARSVDTTVDTDASDANRNSTNRNSTATSIHQTTAYGHPQPQQSHDQPHDQPHEQPSLSRPNAVYSPPPPQTRDLNTDLHRDPHRDRTSHYDPTPATAYYLPTSPRDRPSRSAHHLNSLSQSYSREFRAVDDRIAGYLGRFLRRAKHGPEQERQLLQVIQVEIRDLLRRTIDAEGEGLHVTDLLKESHSRIADLTNNSDNHLEKLMKQHDERLRNHQSKMDAESAEKILASVTKCNLEKLELEEKLSYLSSESNHKLKTCILETEQRIHEREAENTRALKTAARDAETANENYKHQIANITSELQSERRSFLELQESTGKLKQSQAEERLLVQQQLMEVVQTWEKEAASREEAVRVEMEKGFSMRLAAEREMAERQRKTEMRLAEEAFEVEISRCMQALNEKMTANHKNEIVELKQRLTSETMMKVSRQKNEYDDLLRDLKDEVDTALKKIKFKEEELNSREADLKIQQAELRREREGINEQKNELQVRDQINWIEGVASNIIGDREEKMNVRMEQEKRALRAQQMKLNDMMLRRQQGVQGAQASSTTASPVEEEEEEEEDSESYDDSYDSEKERAFQRAKALLKKKSASAKKKSKKIKKPKKSQAPEEPFFDDVDARVNEILLEPESSSSTEKKDKKNSKKKGKDKRRDSLSIDAQDKESRHKKSNDGHTEYPQYKHLSQRPMYSYSAPLGNHSLASDTIAPNKWGEASMAAAWMPRSFYQEYVRTQKGKEDA